MGLGLSTEDFQVDDVYKMQCAMDESDKMYLLNNSEVRFDDIVCVEFNVWILNTHSHVWTKNAFGGGYERFVLQTFLRAYRDKLYLICLDYDKKAAFVSVDLNDDCEVKILKYLDNQYVDVKDTTVYFFYYDGDKLSQVIYYCIKRDSWKESCSLNKKITQEPNMNFIMSKNKIFTPTRVYDILKDGYDVISVPNCNDESFSYVLKTNLQLGFTVENNFNILYLMNVVDLKWTRIHLPEKFLEKCIVCFSWDSSRIYFARFDDDKSLKSIKLYYHSTVTSKLIPLEKASNSDNSSNNSSNNSSSKLDNDVILSIKTTNDSRKIVVKDSVKQQVCDSVKQQVCVNTVCATTRPKRKCTMKRKIYN
jgi:hypothetical protein